MARPKDEREIPLLQRLGFLFFPRRCIFCDEPVEPDWPACATCEKNLPWITGEICPHCGFGLEHCTCQGAFSPLDGNRSVFYYTGRGERGIVQFKFHGRRDAAPYLAHLLTSCVKERYGDISFEGVASVPMFPSKEQERGYNQSDLLARYLSQELDLPYDRDLLRKVRDYPAQHNLSARERRGNVKHAFQLAHPVPEGSVWLLVDDVFTTGSTLGECARLLKGAGASQVYSVTLAASYRREIRPQTKVGCQTQNKPL